MPSICRLSYCSVLRDPPEHLDFFFVTTETIDDNNIKRRSRYGRQVNRYGSTWKNERVWSKIKGGAMVGGTLAP